MFAILINKYGQNINKGKHFVLSFSGCSKNTEKFVDFLFQENYAGISGTHCYP